MNKDHCETLQVAFVGKVLGEHWEGFPWETGRRERTRGRGGGPADVAGAWVQQWGLGLPQPSRRGTGMRSRAGQTPSAEVYFSALEKTLIGSARAP